MGENIINNIKYMLGNSPFTQDMLADYLSVNQTMISKWKNGNRKMSVTHLEKICDLFGCSIEDVINNNVTSKSFNNIKFRTTEITDKSSLESIASINKIVNNLNYMLKVYEENGSK